jgi:hypothetical protein
MSTTGRDVISASLRLIGALASGETPAAQEATDGLSALNRMIDSWSNESLTIYTKPREILTLVAGTASYTMGSGGMLNTTRPLKIENAELRLTDSSPVIERPIRIVNKDEFAGIISKALQSSIPMFLYAEGTYPLETLNFWPVPSVAYQVALYSWKPLSNISTLDTALSFPLGYEEALIYNLAIRLTPEYGKPLSEVVAAIAEESKGNIKRMNIKPLYLSVDSALQSRPSRFNIYTGESL